MSTIHTLAADIADRIPEMARDSKTNNQQFIENMLSTFLNEREAVEMVWIKTADAAITKAYSAPAGLAVSAPCTQSNSPFDASTPSLGRTLHPLPPTPGCGG